MKAFNSRKTPREIYLFTNRGKNIHLTTKKLWFEPLDKSEFYYDTHSSFKIIRDNKKGYIEVDDIETRDFVTQLSKILWDRTEISISQIMYYIKDWANNHRYVLDSTKIKRKYFVSRDLEKIKELLKEKGALKINQNKGVMTMEIKKPENFEDLTVLQKILDEEVAKPRANGFTPRTRIITDIFLSLDDEFQEWLRELPQEYNFKTWKEKVYSRKDELKELTDCLFFFAQYQNTLYSPNPYEYDTTICTIFNNWGSTYKPSSLLSEIKEFKLNLWSGGFDRQFEFECCFESWIAICKLRGFTKQEILDQYFEKWQENMNRPKKDWTIKGIAPLNSFESGEVDKQLKEKVKEYANEKYKRPSLILCGQIDIG